MQVQTGPTRPHEGTGLGLAAPAAPPGGMPASEAFAALGAKYGVATLGPPIGT